MKGALMLLGTHSNAGKSVLATAFCRILAREGVSVAPFKAQNMSNNAGVTPDGGEMGRAQVTQAEAAGIAPHTDMNPVLLKPERGRSQVVLNGRAIGHLDAANWRDLKRDLWTEVRAAYDRLSARFDVVVLEGAGSPAEINLKEADIVNLAAARHAGAPCLLVGDIDRGGVFAALAGTVYLLDERERSQIRGFLVNRFRGDPSLLGDGLDRLRERAFGIPTLGLIPWIDDLGLPEEDAVALDRPASPSVHRDPASVDVAVIHYPLISNFDEFDALAAEPGVGLRYVESVDALAEPDVVILPGSKATMTDLEWLRRTGLADAIGRLAEGGSEIVGFCGGLQMLGHTLADPTGVESAGSPSRVDGLGLLGLDTTFAERKVTERRAYRLETGETVSGYEIHNGESTLTGAVPLGASEDGDTRIWSARNAPGSVWGTYLHDIFANDGFRHGWLRRRGWDGPVIDFAASRERAYDRLADIVRESVDWPRIKALIQEGC